MNLDTTRARRGALIIERITEERIRRGRKEGDTPKRLGVGTTFLVRRTRPEEAAGGPAEIVVVEGTGVEPDPGHQGRRQYTWRSRSVRRSGPTLMNDEFTSSDASGKRNLGGGSESVGWGGPISVPDPTPDPTPVADGTEGGGE